MYFAISTSTQMHSFLVRIHHANLASKAKLKSANFLKPRPPSFFYLNREDQAIGAKYFPESIFGHHQKHLTMASNSAQSPLGIKKVDMVYIRAACATDLIKVACPIQKRFLHFQLLIFDSNLSLT